jgi:alpha-L-fucosidase
LEGTNRTELSYTRDEHCVIINLPLKEAEDFISVIEMGIKGDPVVDQDHALDPVMTSEITTHFADTLNCRIQSKRWMEKFGEWKSVHNIHHWEQGSKATWTVNVIKPGNYLVELTYAGSGRLVWAVDSDEGRHIQNQQNSSHIFNSYPIGWLKFDKAGKHKVSVSLLDGDPLQSELAAIKFTAIDFGDYAEAKSQKLEQR